jgi:hypothetical protein
MITVRDASALPVAFGLQHIEDQAAAVVVSTFYIAD